MRNHAWRTAIAGMLLSISVVGSVGAEQLSGLAGRVFAVEAEVVFSRNPAMPVGLVFDNCYFFNEDGSWDDPLFPDPAAPIQGVWVQHTELPKAVYTATIDDAAPGLLLIQNGTVNPTRGKGNQRLAAYTTAFVDGELMIEIVSTGKAVETCPF